MPLGFHPGGMKRQQPNLSRLGGTSKSAASPEGTADIGRIGAKISRPFGTYDFRLAPNLERLGYSRTSLRDEPQLRSFGCDDITPGSPSPLFHARPSTENRGLENDRPVSRGRSLADVKSWPADR